MQVLADPNDDIIHLAVCAERLSNCHLTLMDVKANPDHALAGAAFRYALVEYANPFNTSWGADKGKHRLEASVHVQAQDLPLHERLIAMRNKLLAHSDLVVLEGRMSFTDLQGNARAVTTLKHVDTLGELRNIADILRLVQTVIDSVFAEYHRRVAAVNAAAP